MSTNVRTEMESLIATVAAAIKTDRATVAALSATVSGLETSGGVSQSTVETLISTAIANLVNGAPEALDTLKEIADELEGQNSAVDAMLTAIANRVSFADVQSLTNQ
ncbi:MAG: hypothetical protein FWH15_07960, partial [Betaproteobacteria bacterium]|nr:hypothetical protein [Betaproteobacteria bacterium]